MPPLLSAELSVSSLRLRGVLGAASEEEAVNIHYSLKFCCDNAVILFSSLEVAGPPSWQG